MGIFHKEGRGLWGGGSVRNMMGQEIRVISEFKKRVSRLVFFEHDY